MIANPFDKSDCLTVKGGARITMRTGKEIGKVKYGDSAVTMDRKITPCRECPLQSCDAFRPLSEDKLEFMQSFKEDEVAYARGEIIAAQGGKSPHLNTMLEGMAIRYRSLEDGRRQIVNFMFPGDLIGLQGAFDDDLSHSVEALTDARLCVFPRNDFHRLMGEHPRLGYDLVWLAAKEETALEGHLVSVGQRTARERVTFLAVWLLDRALATGIADKSNRLDIPITQAQIADMLGLSLVHTNRTLKSLREEGLVDWKPGDLRIEDMKKACDFGQYTPIGEGKRPFI